MPQHMQGSAYEEGRWSLDDLFPATSGPEIEQAFADVQAAADAIEARQSALVPEIEETAFVEILEWIVKLTYVTDKLDGFAVLSFFADTEDQEALALRGRVDTLQADARNRALRFELWWKALDEENARRLLKAAGDNAYYLRTLRRFAPYTLSEVEERIVNVKNVNGAAGLAKLYTMITSNLTFDFESDGESIELTRSELMDYARDESPERREAAFRALLAVYETRSAELSQIYKCIVNDWHAEKVALRGFSSPIAFRDLDNDIPEVVVETLLETCRDNTALYQRYFRLKARWLGLPKLRQFDLLAPLEDTVTEIPFSDGVRLVLDTFRAFSPKLAALAERVLADGHVDSEIRPGKRGGGLSWDALPGLTPWILINYGGRVHDVTTLAHELGHAVHAMMAAEHSALTFSPPLPLAETASSFAQILLLEAMLEGADSELRRTLLAKYIEDSYAQILRQAFRVLFEQRAHRMIVDGATSDEICAAYLETLREPFGDSVEVDEIFRHGWVGISHFYTQPFYDYAYAFGLLLVLALYRRYRAEGDAFVPSYLEILSYGGSKAPLEILDQAGFDIRQRAFWQGGFDVLSGMVGKLEGLVE